MGDKLMDHYTVDRIRYAIVRGQLDNWKGNRSAIRYWRRVYFRTLGFAL
jgi:hypothetical protein